MRGNHRNRRCLPFALGRAGLPVILTALSLMFSLPAFAQQDTSNVPSDIPPGAGNLNKAVQAVITARTLSNTVFELRAYPKTLAARKVIKAQARCSIAS